MAPICGPQDPPCLPGTGASTCPPAAAPPPLCVDVRSWKHERGFLTGRPLMLEGKGEVGGGGSAQVCVQMCACVLFIEESRKETGKGAER